MSPAKRTGHGKTKRSFHRDLVLNRWMLGFFHGGTLEALKTRIADDRFEGLDEDGQTRFFHELVRGLFDPNRIPKDDLRRYDLHIVGHWQAITMSGRNQREGHELQLKYFQYLSLLFTEIYLDWYFNHRQELLDGLNAEMQRYREESGAEPFCDYTAEDLNKIAFWNATGSGKTLLMHVNILQYLHYFQAGNPHHHPDKIILLTPNEGLSRQHLGELKLSGFKDAKLFDKYKADGLVQVIDINKLADTMGEKTVAVEAFEGNNLVLVDEGHRGTGKDARVWMRRRHALVSDGFAFEYSATFGQVAAKGLAVAKAEEEIQKNRAKTLFGTASLKKLAPEELAQLQLSADDKAEARRTATREVYAKCILFDYSYKYFYEDGYGKESLILNMDGEAYEAADNAYKYFTACLLAFYQQLWLWHTHQGKLAEFNIEKPLWVFVGNTVSGEDSDILDVVTFLAWFLNHDQQIKTWLADLVADRAQILDGKGNHIFQGRFQPLMGFSDDVDGLYADILHRVFNASARQRLKMVNIKNSKGELVLRVGDAEPFGLINVGDEGNVFKAAEDHTDFDTERDDFGQTLFDTINDKGCALNVLIGSRKFTEGWSSWRVSTMGLLNMGQGEGSQIIQLFGRGVRLKGRGFSLKRTLPHERPKGAHLDKLETLNIFGVRANYMAAFKDYLREEGITPTDEILELDFPTKANLPDGKLKTLALKDGYKDNQKLGFKRQRFPWLYEIPADMQGKIKPPRVVVDLYPRVEALATGSHKKALADTESRNEGKLDRALFSMFDFDRIYLAVQEYKLTRSWSNLRLERQRLIDFCHGPQDWYTLYIPASELEVASFADVRAQEAILTRLLIDYTDRFYRTLKTGYEGQFYEVVNVSEDDGSMLKLYQFEIQNDDGGLEYLKKLEALKQLVASGDIGKASQWDAPHMVAISFDRHLFYPLFGFESDTDKKAVPLKLRPLGFDAASEIQFVRDLEAFYHSSHGKDAIGGCSLYLLRNASHKSKGLGFALAGNFYPDFLLWLVDDATGKQWLTFVDPKGLKNLDLSNPKLGLYQEVKTFEQKIASQTKSGDAPLVLDAFILSATSYTDLLNVRNKTAKADLEQRHVLFMDDDGKGGQPHYLAAMFQAITAEG